MNKEGEVVRKEVSSPPTEEIEYTEEREGYGDLPVNEGRNESEKQPRKFYVDTGSVEIVADMVYCRLSL